MRLPLTPVSDIQSRYTAALLEYNRAVDEYNGDPPFPKFNISANAKPALLSHAQITWCIERGIFKRDMLADHFADAGKKVAS